MRHFLFNLKLLIGLINRADLIVIRLPCFLSLLAAPLVFFSGKKIAVEVVGDAYEAIAHAKKGRFFYLFFAGAFDVYTRFLISRSVGAIYVTAEQLQIKYPPPKTIVGVASNVVISEVPERVISEREIKINKVWGEGSINIGVIGSYNNNYKGIDVLIDAIAIMRERIGLEVCLHVLGSGDVSQFEKIIMECKADNWVHFDGRKAGSDVLSWIDQMDIYCQPSRTEGLPRSLIEAMSRGCPAVATSVGGMNELLGDDFLVPSDQPALLSDSISSLLLNEKKALAAARRNYEFSKKYYVDALDHQRSIFWEKVRFLVERN